MIFILSSHSQVCLVTRGDFAAPITAAGNEESPGCVAGTATCHVGPADHNVTTATAATWLCGDRGEIHTPRSGAVLCQSVAVSCSRPPKPEHTRGPAAASVNVKVHSLSYLLTTVHHQRVILLGKMGNTGSYHLSYKVMHRA